MISSSSYSGLAIELSVEPQQPEYSDVRTSSKELSSLSSMLMVIAIGCNYLVSYEQWRSLFPMSLTEWMLGSKILLSKFNPS